MHMAGAAAEARYRCQLSDDQLEPESLELEPESLEPEKLELDQEDDPPSSPPPRPLSHVRHAATPGQKVNGHSTAINTMVTSHRSNIIASRSSTYSQCRIRWTGLPCGMRRAPVSSSLDRPPGVSIPLQFQPHTRRYILDTCAHPPDAKQPARYCGRQKEALPVSQIHVAIGIRVLTTRSSGPEAHVIQAIALALALGPLLQRMAMFATTHPNTVVPNHTSCNGDANHAANAQPPEIARLVIFI